MNPRVLWLALLPLLGCGESAGMATTANAAVAPGPVLATAEAATYQPAVEVTGSLEPIASVHLGFDVGGRLDQLRVSRGDVVSAGQALASLDDTIARAQLEQAESAGEAARAQAEATATAYDRLQQLGSGLSAQQLDQARAARDAAAAQLRQAQAAASLARANVRFHTLVAPIDGTITDAPDNVGALVGPGNPLFVIEDTHAMRLKGDVSEADGWINAGDPVQVVAGPPGATVTVAGVVERVIPSLSPATRRLPIDVRVDDPTGLRAHQFARATVKAAQDQPAVRIPPRALVATPEFSVWVVPEGADPKRVPVRVVEETADAVIIVGEVAPGDRVAVDPPHDYGAKR